MSDLARLDRALRAEAERDALQHRLGVAMDRASKDPLGVDVSDYSDEWVAGFLAGQANAIDYLLHGEDG